MTSSLPTIISDYLAAADRGDVEAIVGCFANDATVLDEDQEIDMVFECSGVPALANAALEQVRAGRKTAVPTAA